MVKVAIIIQSVVSLILYCYLPFVYYEEQTLPDGRVQLGKISYRSIFGRLIYL